MNEFRQLLFLLLRVFRWFPIDVTNSDCKRKKNLQLVSANVANCWVKYDLFLFGASRNLSISEKGNSMMDPQEIWTPKNDRNVENSLKCTSEETFEKKEDELYFESIDLSEYENQVVASLIETTEEARKLCLHAHSWVKKAQAFFTLNEHPIEYVNSILDLSELYRFLVYFEKNIECQYNAQKLRADSIETLCELLKQVRPQCYLMVSVELYRELAEVQLEMMGLNLKRISMVQESVPDRSEMLVNKVEALSEVHAKLEQFSNHSNYDLMRVNSDVLHDTDK